MLPVAGWLDDFKRLSLLQAAKIKSFGPTALVLHSGDVFNPCLLSTITQARQRMRCCSPR
jgi:hypothetical protein